VFVPMYDDNPLRSIKFAYVNVMLIALNIAVFMFEISGVDDKTIADFAIIPKELFEANIFGSPATGTVPQGALVVPEPYTLISYMFLHGDILHLGGNMLFLWVFGDNVEDAVGHLKYILFYLACGVFAALVHSWISPASDVPLIGASGAVAGVIAAYIMLHPRVRVWVLALRAIPLRISAALALGAWIATQITMVALPYIVQDYPYKGPVAWWAHIGGLIAGAVLILFLRRRGVPLFDKRLTAT